MMTGLVTRRRMGSIGIQLREALYWAGRGCDERDQISQLMEHADKHEVTIALLSAVNKGLPEYVEMILPYSSAGARASALTLVNVFPDEAVRAEVLRVLLEDRGE